MPLHTTLSSRPLPRRWTTRVVATCVLPVLLLAAAVRSEEIGDANDDLKITILSTMLADAAGTDAYSTLGEWGFAALVEVGGGQYLYDTGYHPDVVASNAASLGIDLSSVTTVILSHNHRDHTGGLLTLRESLSNSNAGALSHLHVGDGFAARRGSSADAVAPTQATETLGRFLETDGRVTVHRIPAALAPGVWLTGPVPRRHDERNWSGSGLVNLDNEIVEDNIPEDMAMVIETSRGLVILSGCGHAGIINIIDHAMEFTGSDSVLAAVGGFHLLAAGRQDLVWTAANLERAGC